ncbi:RteC domain-containing protein [uncultured Flavobacterium sp.]|jgi:hypothetical protein|uniref:RteC domain-containing protein n=1 Tax=uncultured Flavobacterium sp. TaxID=165435 RepID=UPI0025CE9DAB|nr:RteC domain-containing protein [uncultured Flavobacterium sp.]
MKYSINTIISDVRHKEDKLSHQTDEVLEEAYQMVQYLKELLHSTKDCVTKEGFTDEIEEINFFRNIKPYIVGKLIYYNKVFRIETICPVRRGKMYHKFFLGQLQDLKQEFKEHICGSHFYRYYRSGRTDRDREYFTRGNINYRDGLNSYVFEIDHQFSTYYDSKAARIVANELLYTYLVSKINPDDTSANLFQDADSIKDIFWTDSKNALIELIYALHASGVISHGKIGIRKITLVFQILFRVQLGDIHHAFHRMKERSGTKTSFLDNLKYSLEHYMEKGV